MNVISCSIIFTCYCCLRNSDHLRTFKLSCLLSGNRVLSENITDRSNNYFKAPWVEHKMAIPAHFLWYMGFCQCFLMRIFCRIWSEEKIVFFKFNLLPVNVMIWCIAGTYAKWTACLRAIRFWWGEIQNMIGYSDGCY